MLEKALISAVVHTREEPVYRVSGVEPARLFGALAEAAVNVDTIVQTGPEIVFSAPVEDKADARRTLDALAADWSAREDLGKVSVIGAGMKSHPGVAAKTFATLEREGIAPAVVSTSPIRSPVTSAATRSTEQSRSSTRRSSLPSGGDRNPRIGVVGGTGAVGTVTLGLLREHGFENVRVFASARSAGKQVAGWTVEEATPAALERGDVDVFLFSVGTSASRELVPHAVAGGATAVDKSSAYRLEPGIPLVVPEVNGNRALENAASSRTRTAARSRSPASSSRSTTRRGSCAFASRPTSRSPERAPRRWSASRTRRPPTTTCAWTGSSTARSSTRSRSSAPRPRRSWSCRSCRSRRPASASRHGRPRRGGLDRDRTASLGRPGRAKLLGAAPSVSSTTSRHPGRRPESTRCSSAGSAAIRPSRTASPCSSRATTSARAPR